MSLRFLSFFHEWHELLIYERNHPRCCYARIDDIWVLRIKCSQAVLVYSHLCDACSFWFNNIPLFIVLILSLSLKIAEQFFWNSEE